MPELVENAVIAVIAASFILLVVWKAADAPKPEPASSVPPHLSSPASNISTPPLSNQQLKQRKKSKKGDKKGDSIKQVVVPVEPLVGIPMSSELPTIQVPTATVKIAREKGLGAFIMVDGSRPVPRIASESTMSISTLSVSSTSPTAIAQILANQIQDNGDTWQVVTKKKSSSLNNAVSMTPSMSVGSNSSSTSSTMTKKQRENKSKYAKEKLAREALRDEQDRKLAAYRREQEREAVS
jgi:hypothetical protein